MHMFKTQVQMDLKAQLFLSSLEGFAPKANFSY